VGGGFSYDDLPAWLEECCEAVDMLEEAGCGLAGWPLDLAEQDPLAPLRPLVVAGGLAVAVNGIVRIQAGVRGWIVRRRVAQYRRWQALEEKEARAEAWSRLRTAAFAAARAARQAHVDKGTARRAASAANARAAADVASATLAVDYAVSVVGVQAAGAAAVRIQARWRRHLGHRRYFFWEGELCHPDDCAAQRRRRKRSERACTGREAAALRDAEWMVAKRGHKHRGRRKGGKGGQKARTAAAAADAAATAAAARLPERTAENFAAERGSRPILKLKITKKYGKSMLY
jgi:hypothetical protein